MKVGLTGSGVLAVAAIGAAAVAALAAWKKGPQAIKDAANAVNPLNNNNVFAQGANAVTSSLTGRDETLGGWFRSVTSNDDQKIADMLNGTDQARYTGSEWSTQGEYNNPSAYVAAPSEAFDSVGGFYGQAGALY